MLRYSAKAILVAALIVISAQDSVSGDIAQKRANSDKEVNNGTDPTLLTTKFGIQCQHNQINSKLSTGLWEAFVTIPIGVEKRMLFEFTTSYASGPLDTSFGGGDIALKFLHVANVEATWATAYAAELFLDTAERSDLGYDETVLEFSAFYARLLRTAASLPLHRSRPPVWKETIRVELISTMYQNSLTRSFS